MSHPILQVWYAERGTSISCHERLWDEYQPLFPAELRQRLESFINWQDRQLNLLGKLLVCHALEDVGTERDILKAYGQGENGRPFVNLPGAPDFNLSHSGDYAVCAVLSGGGRVGIDIERVRDIQLADFERFFPPAAWQAITGADDKIGTFYRYWTICESVAKAHGDGIGGPIRDIQIQGDKALYSSQIWHVKKINIHPEYCCHLATNIVPTASTFHRLGF